VHRPAHDVLSKADFGAVRVAVDYATFEGQVGDNLAALGEGRQRQQPSLFGHDHELAACGFAHDEGLQQPVRRDGRR
jgi:hypothetical protein